MERGKTSLVSLAAALCGLCSVAAVPPLPEPVRPLAEVETNVVFSCAPRDNILRLSVELSPSASNNLEIVLGHDADGDGVLGVDEGRLSVGWDCGAWFLLDRREVQFPECPGSRLDCTLRLADEMKTWNLLRVVSRGAEAVHVEAKATIDALRLKIR